MSEAHGNTIVTITHRWTQAAIWSGDAETVKDAVHKAIASGCDLRRCNLSHINLSYSNLSGSDLSHSNLSGCDLSGCDLRDCNLSGCDLRDCNLSHSNLSYSNLSGSNLSYSDLRDSDLSGCDLRGCDLSGCDLRDCNLSHSNLSHSNLSDCDLSGCDLSDCDLSGCDLSYSNLSGCDLSGCDLRGGVFTNAIFARTVGVTAPVIPHLDAAILAAINGHPERLDMGSWHSCETTHCRAGWAIQLAGLPGRMLEDRIGPAAAGALIYAASRPGQPIPNFHESQDGALADLQAWAARDPLPESDVPRG
jgi:uncharacterized protein YjbI with pentapeptide repeats